MTWDTWKGPGNTVLSILIPSMPSRLGIHLPRILAQLEAQIGARPDIELLVLMDNKKRSTGAKRNELMRLAQGTYFAFVDDDDRIADDYLSSILEHVSPPDDSEGPADVVVFRVHVSGYESWGLPDKETDFDISHPHDNNGPLYLRKPNHIMVWRTALVRDVPFEDVCSAEDTMWAFRASPLVKRQVKINRVLYYYQFDPYKSPAP